ncbi:MAG: putative dehydrogenase subunit [Candidatus Scalindua rubra]|uniref:Putative dehydrogenase subunit n=1 Tax=Candidatus Scalindua rubra TaxID=1872076 RepID=A0A1E3X791_9BACT|nr:MAG: putative dehydrogenase subunit [Candidatus Scalindua rubra]
MKKLPHIIVFAILVFLAFIINNTKSISAEVVVLHANEAWKRTDIILREHCIITWQVQKDDYWSFNTEIFPEGHNADGIPVPALESYALPGEDIGMLLGKTGDGRIISMGLSGSDYVMPNEGGNYLYLTMNDDLIGKYGEGFEDNKGEILVTIIQTPRKIVKIDILFIENCPGVIPTTKHIKDIIADEAIDAEINLILIETLEDARRLHFTGSPSVRINGMDIETNSGHTKDYGLRSRLYYIDGKQSGHPSKSMIRNAIKKVK